MNVLKVIADICVGSKKANRSAILKFEDFAKKQPQIDIPVTHRIHGGMYMREITIPKGCVLTGQIYKFNHFDIMLGGDITVSTDGGETKRLTGNNIFNGLHGKKRAGYAHEDTRWITIHPFSGSNGDEIQSRITAETFEELRGFEAESSKLDFELMISSIGISKEEMTIQSESEDDMVKDVDLSGSVYLSDSLISGKGIFASRDFMQDEFICMARMGGQRTIAGRYTNHGFQENAEIKVTDSGVKLFAKEHIYEGEEITVDYRNVINHRLVKGDLCQG